MKTIATIGMAAIMRCSQMGCHYEGLNVLCYINERGMDLLGATIPKTQPIAVLHHLMKTCIEAKNISQITKSLELHRYIAFYTDSSHDHCSCTIPVSI